MGGELGGTQNLDEAIHEQGVQTARDLVEPAPIRIVEPFYRTEEQRQQDLAAIEQQNMAQAAHALGMPSLGEYIIKKDEIGHSPTKEDL